MVERHETWLAEERTSEVCPTFKNTTTLLFCLPFFPLSHFVPPHPPPANEPNLKLYIYIHHKEYRKHLYCEKHVMLLTKTSNGLSALPCVCVWPMTDKENVPHFWEHTSTRV